MLLNKKITKATVVTVVIIGLLFFLHYLKITQPIENLLRTFTKPAISLTYGLSQKISDTYNYFQQNKDLQKKNTKLHEQLINLTKEQSICNEDRQENEFLRQQLNFIKSNDFEYVIANVIGKAPDNRQNVLIIDRGESAGITIGQPVLGEGGILIGTINKTQKNSALVLLINDDFSKIAVKAQNSQKTIGLAEGEFGLGIKMRLIPQSENLKAGDIIVTSGLEENIPKGLIIGTIESVKKESEDLFQEASIKSMANLNKISIVNIIKKSHAE